MHTKESLQQKQSLPLDAKVLLTKQRIKEWVDEYGIDGVYVSFSGGKDSTVLLHLAREMYPNIKAAFADTGLEYPELRQFVKTFDNVDWVKPKMNFKEVIIRFGYPFISKEVGECVYGARRYLTRLIDENIILTNERTNERTNEPHCIQKHKLYDVPIEQYVNSEEVANLLNERKNSGSHSGENYFADMMGWRTKTGEIKAGIPIKDRVQFSQVKWRFMFKAPFEISNRCCRIMKKSPMHTYTNKTGRYPITAQMASESRLRTQQWLQNGCNGFDMKKPVSNPMSFWFEQDVLLYIKLNNLQIAPVYGDIVCEDGEDFCTKGRVGEGIFELNRPSLTTTGCYRTGCCMCGFGLHLDDRPNRFEMINKYSNPNIQDYILRGGEFNDKGLWQPSNDGLGYWFVMRWLNIHGKLDMYIPNYYTYKEKYGNNMTDFYLDDRGLEIE